jgi:hypothetical protein
VVSFPESARSLLEQHTNPPSSVEEERHRTPPPPLAATAGQRKQRSRSKSYQEEGRNLDLIEGNGSHLLHSGLQPLKQERKKDRPYTAPDLAEIWSSAPLYRHHANLWHQANKGQTAQTTTTLYKPSLSSISPPIGGAAEFEGEEGSGKKTDSQGNCCWVREGKGESEN